MHQFNITKGLKGIKTSYENIVRSRIPKKDKEKVLHRLKVLDHAQKFGIASAVDAYNVCERTIRYWRAKQRESHGVMAKLAPESTKPNHLRSSKLPQNIKEYIRDLKRAKPRLGKEKIVELVKLDTGYITSASTVWRVIQYYKKRGELPDRYRVSLSGKTGRLIIRKPKKNKKKLRRKDYVPGYPGDLVQIDTVVIHILGTSFYVLTAIDIVTRIAYAFVSRSHSSKVAEEFLRYIPNAFGYTIKRVQTDNGSEFAKHFDDACIKLDIEHFWNYPRHPKQNAYIERFNRTIQEEWLTTCQRLFIQGELDRINEELVKWLLWYNTTRPHWGLHLETPRGYTERIMREGCNMCLD